MKKSTIVLVGLFLLTASGHSQGYKKITDNCGWYIYAASMSGQWFDWYKYQNDTIINTLTYIKYENSNNYSILLREDTLLKACYYIDPYDSTEKIIYDFSLQVNDNINITGTGVWGTHTYTVMTIDTVPTPIGDRRRWTLTTSTKPILSTMHWIEGVGCVEYPFYTHGFHYSEPVYGFVCSYNQEGQSYYSGNYNCDTISNLCENVPITINSTHKIIQNNLDIYPNPVRFDLHFNKNITNPTIKIFDIIGNQIEPIIISEKSIDVSKFTKGTYFIEYGGIVKKFIKL